jgi:hypothetical protein
LAANGGVFHVHHGTEEAEHLLDGQPWRGRRWAVTERAQIDSAHALSAGPQNVGPVSE